MYSRENVPIEDLGLSLRTYTALKKSSVNFLSELLKMYPKELKEKSSIEDMHLKEIDEVLEKLRKN